MAYSYIRERNAESRAAERKEFKSRADIAMAKRQTENAARVWLKQNTTCFWGFTLPPNFDVEWQNKVAQYNARWLIQLPNLPVL